MTLHIVHRAVLREEMSCRRARTQDREAIEDLLLATSTRREVLADFDFAMDPLQLDLNCFIFECNDTMLGLAILRLVSRERYLNIQGENKHVSFILCCSTEKQINFITSHYHIEDYVSVQNIPHDGYGRLLHFVLMPIFSAYHRFFFREIARLSELTVIFYRLHHEDESALVSASVYTLSNNSRVSKQTNSHLVGCLHKVIIYIVNTL